MSIPTYHDWPDDTLIDEDTRLLALVHRATLSGRYGSAMGQEIHIELDRHLDATERELRHRGYRWGENGWVNHNRKTARSSPISCGPTLP